MDPKDDGLIEVLSFLVKVLFDYPTSKLVVPNLYTLAQTSTTTWWFTTVTSLPT